MAFLKFQSQPISTTVSFIQGDDGLGNIGMKIESYCTNKQTSMFIDLLEFPTITICLDTFKRLYQSPNGPLYNKCLAFMGYTGDVNTFYNALLYCVEDQVKDGIKTTTDSNAFSNMFDVYDYDNSYEKYQSLEELLNATRLEIFDIVSSFKFDSINLHPGLG